MDGNQKPPPRPPSPTAPAPPAKPDPGAHRRETMSKVDALIDKLGAKDQSQPPPSQPQGNEDVDIPPEPPPGKPAEPAKPAEPKTQLKLDALDTFKKEEKPAEPAEPAKPEPEIKGGNRELRNAYENVKSELKKREARIAELEKISNEKLDPEVTKRWDGEKQKYEERIKRIEGELAAIDFSKSTEFQETYQEPINQAYANGIQRFAKLKVMNEEGENRTVTQADLDKLLTLPLEEAVDYAEQ